MKSGIYIIGSKIHPERIYIGSAVNIPARWNRHRRELKKKVHHNARLQNHVNKYGLKDLYLEARFLYPPELLIRAEQCFINAFSPFFNINPTAGSRLGAKHSNQTKLKISKASKAVPKENIINRYARQMNLK